jgi:hypothetical protein
VLLGVAAWISAAAPARAEFIIGVNVAGTNITQEPPLNGSRFEFIPPDTDGAIGPNNFVELVNGAFAVYDKATGALAAPRVSMTTFWQDAGITGLSNNPGTPGAVGTTDPRILYDADSGRWFAVAIDQPPSGSGANRILVAVSHSSDPTAGFQGFAIQSNSTGLSADMPSIGIDRNGLYVATRNIDQATNNSTEGVLVLPKSDLLLPTPTVANRTLIENVPVNSLGLTVQAVVDLNGTGLPHPLLASFNDSNLKLSSIGGSITAPTLNTSDGLIALPSGSNVNTLNARQPNGDNTIDSSSFGARITSTVIEQGGYLWGVNTITTGDHESLRWYRIDAATGRLAESGLISDPDHDYYYGSIAVNPRGDVVIGYTRSGPTEFASAFASIGSFDGSTTTFGDPTLLKAGVANYDLTFGGARNRWGDYSTTTIDPDDPSRFWTIQEWASATNVWSTEITEIDIVPEPAGLAMFGVGLAVVAALAGSRRLKYPCRP